MRSRGARKRGPFGPACGASRRGAAASLFVGGPPRPTVSRKWLRERSKDSWYKAAKREGWRSRASYKLIQIQEKMDLIEEGDKVVDLGAAPGGWSQVALELVGPDGAVVGIDLDRIVPLEGATFIKGDMTRAETVAKALEAIGGAADVVISDMSPNISGSYSTDQARSVWLCENALQFADKALKRNGRFVAKVFEGDLFPGFLDQVRDRFMSVRMVNPEASRKASSEVYVVGLGFRGPGKYREPQEAPQWEEGQGLPPSRKAKRAEPES